MLFLAADALTGIGIVGGALVGIATAYATLRTIGPDRDKKLMENFERKIAASEGETLIWKRRAEDAEARLKVLEQGRNP